MARPGAAAMVLAVTRSSANGYAPDLCPRRTERFVSSVPNDTPIAPAAPAPPTASAAEVCDWCGATTVTWRKCKLICVSCGQIVKSCADL